MAAKEKLLDEHLQGYLQVPEAMTDKTVVLVVEELIAVRRRLALAEKIIHAWRNDDYHGAIEELWEYDKA